MVKETAARLRGACILAGLVSAVLGALVVSLSWGLFAFAAACATVERKLR